MFVKVRKNEKRGRKGEKDVDNGRGGVVLYSSAREKGHERAPEESAGILKTIQRRERNDS